MSRARAIHVTRQPDVVEAVRALKAEKLSRVDIMRRLGLTDSQMARLAALDLVRFAARRMSRQDSPPGPELPAEPPALPPVVVDRGTIARWAVERGLAHNARHLDLDAVNAKRVSLGLPPFAVRERAPGHAGAPAQAPAQATENRP